MDPLCKSAVVEWQEGYPLGLISLKSIQEPRLAIDAYIEDQDEKAKCQGFQCLHPAKLFKISGKLKIFRVDFFVVKKTDFSK